MRTTWDNLKTVTVAQVFIFKWSFSCRLRHHKKLRRLVRRKCHIEIELCVRLSVLQLLHVGHVAQNRRGVLSLAIAWCEQISCKARKWNIYCGGLALSWELQIWKSRVVIWQTASKNCTKTRVARAERLFFPVQPIKSLIYGLVFAVTVVISWTPQGRPDTAKCQEFAYLMSKNNDYYTCCTAPHVRLSF